MPKTNRSISYQFEPENHRSAAYIENECIGHCDFESKNGQWFITHTQVDPSYGGQGIARHLVNIIQTQAKEQNIPLIPICTYAVKVLG